MFRVARDPDRDRDHPDRLIPKLCSQTLERFSKFVRALDSMLSAGSTRRNQIDPDGAGRKRCPIRDIQSPSRDAFLWLTPFRKVEFKFSGMQRAPRTLGLVIQTMRKVIQSATILVALVVLVSTLAHAIVTAIPASIEFGQQTVGTVGSPIAVTVTNTGKEDVNILSAVLSASQFSYSGPTLPINLVPGQSLTFFVQFEPAAARIYRGTLIFRRLPYGQAIAISLQGTGVQAQEQPPTIMTQPVSQTVTAGQTATFSVVSTGTAPLAYQWNQNAAPISGATSSSYTTAAEIVAEQQRAVHRHGNQQRRQRHQQRRRSHRGNASAVAPAITTPTGQPDGNGGPDGDAFQRGPARAPRSPRLPVEPERRPHQRAPPRLATPLRREIVASEQQRAVHRHGNQQRQTTPPATPPFSP